MDRTALIGIAVVGVVGTGLAALALWSGTNPSVVPTPAEPTTASPVASDHAAPRHDLDALRPRPPAPDATAPLPGQPDRPSTRRPAQESSPLLQPSDARFDQLAHRPLFDAPGAHVSAQSHAELIADVRSEAEDFESQMKAIADTAPEPVAREAMERAAIVYDRLAMELPTHPPADVREEDVGAWVQSLDRQRVELHERARALRDIE